MEPTKTCTKMNNTISWKQYKKFYTVNKLLDEQQILITALQETRVTDENTIVTGNYRRMLQTNLKTCVTNNTHPFEKHSSFIKRF